MKNKKLMSILLVSAILGTTLGTTAVSAADETSVSLWTWSPITRTAEKMIDAFEKANPDITIDYTNYNYNPEYLQALSAASASDNLADIVGLQPGSLTQTYSDYLIDLSDYAKAEWGDDWTSVYDNVTQSQLQLGNKDGDDGHYILPIETQDIYVEYNKTLFEQLGLRVPTTYDELVEVSKTLRDNGYAPLFFGGADGWQHVNLLLMCTSQISDTLFDECQNGEKAWTCDEMKQAMTNYKKLFDDGVMQDGSLSSTSYSDGTTLFLAGQAGMMLLGSWWAQEYTSEDVSDAVANWDYDYFYLPALEEGLSDSKAIGGVDFGYGITKNCENPDLAWKALVSFATGEGAQEIANDMNNHLSYPNIEPDTSAMVERDGLQNVVDEFNRSGKDIAAGLVNQRIAEPTIETAIQEAMQGLIGGTYSVDEATQHIQDAQDAL
ncbi:ABC transporter substrate-binding protein [Blautia sp.]|jgi:raffinose/stachyose/melibiose transport system substrate-binding protein|uniref:ABC transporter substrate-binding protein n=1 Tax=Blautia sp. TaxID=1955243 RepID=UPI00258C5A5B|nr:extracellular solute-binding protein [Blautia sp.]